MRRPWHIAIVFLCCLGVVFGAMAWVSATALRLERERTEAQRSAALQENVRLALWRMDSFLSPIVAQENARPHHVYAPFHFATQHAPDYADRPGSPLPLISPLRDNPPWYARLYFQYGPGRELTSPQAPMLAAGRFQGEGEKAHKGRSGNLLLGSRAAPLEDETMRPLLEELSYNAEPEQLAERVVAPREGSEPWERNARYFDNPAQQVESAMSAQTPPVSPSPRPFDAKAPQQQAARNEFEEQARAQLQQETIPQVKDSNMANIEAQTLLNLNDLRGPEVVEGTMAALWSGDALLLARSVRVNGAQYIQGCWLDWPKVRARLLDQVRDLLPNADVVPDTEVGDSAIGRRLVALPLVLEPGRVPFPVSDGLSAIEVSLIVAWACVLIAAAAVAVLLVGAVSLSERRAAFVSSVTHELRTPLTSFRMYAEMLAEGMVLDERKRKRYLTTLRTEADRLGHLIENVLSFARLERGRSRRNFEVFTPAALRDRILDRLHERVEQAKMTLAVEDGAAWERLRICADPAAVEQILFNLVDNACKYAAQAADRRIHLQAESRGSRVLLRVRDHGPGISRADAAKLFRPFHKSARQAAATAPGVGLGLALSRRLARDVGGRLRLENPGKAGASFVLILPSPRP